MSSDEVVERLRAELGADAVLTGDQISPDYGLDEMLKAEPVQPIGGQDEHAGDHRDRDGRGDSHPS